MARDEDGRDRAEPPLAALAAGLSALASLAIRLAADDAVRRAATGPTGLDPLLLRRLLSERPRRDRIFGTEMPEPAWRLILALLVAEADGAHPRAAALVRATGITPHTAAHWLKLLDANGLIARLDESAFPRAATYRLTEKAIAAAERHLRSENGFDS